jgi:ParB-like chromosome segregation protein Spo0J
MGVVTQKVKLSEVKLNPNNPRLIKDDKFEKLVKSIKDFPEMLDIRPIVVNVDMVILGGNMRFKACKEAGLKEVPIIVADNLTEDQQREFLIKDNTSGGEWDFEMLANEWDVEQLEEWGLDVPITKDLNEQDLFDIEIPFYTPSEIVPDINELANLDKTKNLIDKINLLEVDNELKEVLKARASFFTDFNFQKIADFYSSQDEKIQEVFKDLGMVILAPKEAVERGFVELSESVFEL